MINYNDVYLYREIITQTQSKDTGVRLREPQGFASPVEKNLHPAGSIFFTALAPIAPSCN
jgi:hypothetical protein